MDGKLSQMKRGESARILTVENQGTMRRRLHDVGFRQGALVRCLSRGPLGDPIAYELLGTVIALRKEDACQIQVRSEKARWD